MSQEPGTPMVLTASVHDVRNFSTLIRGVGFSNRGTFTLSESSVVVKVEEARTLIAAAFIPVQMFDEFMYNPDVQPGSSSQNSQDDDESRNIAFEIPLNILIDCLNIYGTAGSSGPATTSLQPEKSKRWRRAGEDEAADNDRPGTAGGRIDQYFAVGEGKGTGMRMSYAGSGHPLTLLIAEEASGPTTTCEIATFEAEPQLDLPFESEKTVLKIILKSSWLRDALSEIDSTCDKLTLIGNPPLEDLTPDGRFPGQKPMLRIQSSGTFGSTEMDYPNDRDVLETFECTQPVSFTYRFSHISRAIRALQSSSKTSLRIDDEGLLSLQFLVPGQRPRGESVDAFIEFKCLPLDAETS